MKELDVLLERFMTAGYDALPAAERRAFVDLLEKNDPDLYALIIGQTRPGSAVEARLAERIRAHKKPAGAAG